MRANRTSLATVLSIALAVVPGTVAAQATDEEPDAVSHWTSTPTTLQVQGVPGGIVDFFDWGYRTTGRMTGTVDADDPRASGELSMVVVLDVADNDISRGEGRFRLVNDGGTFEGTVHAIQFADGSEVRMSLGQGKDGYEGLSFAMTEYVDPSGEGREQGVIWEGDLPPMPDADLLPA